MLAVRNLVRAAVRTSAAAPSWAPAMVSARRNYASHGTDPTEDEPEAFNKFWVEFFNKVEDQFELRRGTMESFSRDIVPSPEVLIANFRASRRLSDFANTQRALERLSGEVTQSEYALYLKELEPTMKELGINDFKVLIKSK